MNQNEPKRGSILILQLWEVLIKCNSNTWLIEAEKPNFWGSVWQFQAKGVDGKMLEISGILTNGDGQPPASINKTEQVGSSESRDAITPPAEPAPTEN